MIEIPKIKPKICVDCLSEISEDNSCNCPSFKLNKGVKYERTNKKE